MFNHTSQFLTTELPALAAALDVRLPKPITTAIARVADTPTAYPGPIPTRGELAAAVIASHERGADPATDPDVQRLFVASKLGEMNFAVAREGAETDLHQTLIAHADEIVAGWTPAVERIAADITDAARLLPHVNDLDAPASARSFTDTQAAAWANARHAIELANRIVRAWRNLDAATGFAGHSPRRLALAIADTKLAQFDNVQGKPDIWKLARNRAHIAIATGDEYRRRSTQLDADRAAAEPAAYNPHHSPSLVRIRGGHVDVFH